jgi:arylsulfatase A-like enzyme
MLPPHDPFNLWPQRHRLFAEAEKQFSSLRANVPVRIKHKAREDWIKYHANVLGIDEIVGQLLAKVSQRGLDENTLVIFVSDHGDHLCSHGLNSKNQFYEEAAGIPLIFRLPGTSFRSMLEDQEAEGPPHACWLGEWGGLA